jgi:CcmD family protein
MENSGYLFAAYAVIWAVVFGYILFMQWKQKKLQQQITLLEQSVDGQKTTDAE